MARTQSRELAVYVVWVPELGARDGNVSDATRLMSDARARHYWDAGESVGRRYARLLFDPDMSPLWDFYMLFDRDAAWRGNAAPQPALWMHQLGRLNASHRLDPERFAREAARLLAAGERRPDETSRR